jgi:ubiquitin-protein ligase
MAAELKKLRDSTMDGVTVTPCERDVGIWTVCIKGPAETVYSGTDYHVNISTGWDEGEAGRGRVWPGRGD